MKTGWNRIFFPDGSVVEGPIVVVTDDEGVMLSWHVMLGEEAMVEWRGGAYWVK